tara:strand:+ start:340 stop:570 length:231 start_codon:yes stop_codon:yes gene_type:complete
MKLNTKKLNTNADHAHELDLLVVAYEAMETEYEEALANDYDPAYRKRLKHAILNAKHKARQFAETHWHRIIAVSHL